ncbi:hypothetical protein [Phyllobacterium chamaecytisi]|uniref:hypothetical protein n=1 Tax=Phyllobacterium chamaecytisi TaxID=2876082 RepID=UPI001CCA1E66|nr:hypothetical protein [Phyllobacterium sp. KW56]MBZ9602468.1 hypothetical protein [Phyllobacterium sp. KW56]
MASGYRELYRIAFQVNRMNFAGWPFTEFVLVKLALGAIIWITQELRMNSGNVRFLLSLREIRNFKRADSGSTGILVLRIRTPAARRQKDRQKKPAQAKKHGEKPHNIDLNMFLVCSSKNDAQNRLSDVFRLDQNAFGSLRQRSN